MLNDTQFLFYALAMSDAILKKEFPTYHEMSVLLAVNVQGNKKSRRAKNRSSSSLSSVRGEQNLASKHQHVKYTEVFKGNL